MLHIYGGMRSPDRGSTTGAASWTDRERSERAAPQGRAKRVNPPSPPYFKKSSYASTGFFSHIAHLRGMRSPDRGSTTGAASWTDRERSERAAPQGRAKRVNPPSPPYFKKSSYASTGFFSHIAHLRGMRSPDRSCIGVKQQSPVSRALKTEYLSVVSVERPLTERRADAIVFIETNNPNHLIFFETGQRIAKP